MKNFLEQARGVTKTLLAYGNVNDLIIDHDLLASPFSVYLVRLLKAQGYQHIVFYGDEGNHGAFCLDAESARFWLRNPDAPPVRRHEINEQGGQGSTSSEQTSDQSGTQAVKTRSIRTRVRKRPGDDPEVTQTGESAQAAPAASVVYGEPALLLSEFWARAVRHLRDSKAQCAVVFYDIFNTRVLENPQILNFLNTDFETLRAKNLCILLAPATEASTQSMLNRLHGTSLSGKFCIQGEQTLELNPDTCFRVGMPGLDEVQHLLQRLAIVGTDNGNRLQVAGVNLEKASDSLLYIARNARGLDKPLTLRYISENLVLEVDRCAADGFCPLTQEFIEHAFGRQDERTNNKDVLAPLRRDGWENAVALMEKSIKKIHAMQNALPKVQKEAPKLGVDRCITVKETVNQRVKIPNYVIYGAQGTGKSTIARHIGDILHGLGVLRLGHCVEVSKADLVDPHVGGIERRTIDAIDRAEEGVLFLDEAHNLLDEDGGANHEPTGRQIIRTLVHAMTDPSRHFSVVLAGYPEGIQKLISEATDPGLPRRFEGNFITLDDYKPELLRRILMNMVTERGHSFAPGLLRCAKAGDESTSPLAHFIDRLYYERDRSTFGNAGAMETLANNLIGEAERGNVITKASFVRCGYSEDWFKKVKMDDQLSVVMAEFNEKIVGMEGVKNWLSAEARRVAEAMAKGKSLDDLGLTPIVLSGEPGTGKTTVAKMLGRMYHALGLLGSDQPIIHSASEFTSSLVNAANETMGKWVKEAQNRRALLFVDEAHQLRDQGKREGFQTLMAPLTDKEHPFMLVLASYPKFRDELLQLDPGGASRFRVIELPNYSGKELHQIFHKMLGTEYSVSDEADRTLRRVCEYFANTHTERSGNGRRVENLLKELHDLRRARCEQMQIPYSDPRSNIIEEADIPQFYLDRLPDEEKPMAELREEILESFSSQFVGLEDVQDWIEEQADLVEERIILDEPVVTMPVKGLVISANPGAGKTSIVRFLADAMFRLNLLSSKEPLIMSGSQLLNRYVNATQEDTHRIIQQAREENRLLVIDEAHQLLSGSEHFVSNTGQEAIQAFMAPLTETTHPLRVIFIVYLSREEEFLAADPGMRERVQVIRIPDYDGPMLFRIFEKIAQRPENAKRTLAPELLDAVRAYCDVFYAERTPTSGNGRKMESLYQEICFIHRRRCRRQGIDAKNETYWVLTEEDLPDEIREAIG